MMFFLTKETEKALSLHT